MIFASRLHPQSLSLPWTLMHKYFLFIVSLFLLIGSCGKEQTPPLYPVPACFLDSVYYSPQNADDVRSTEKIIRTNCGSAAGASCHAPGNGNYDFTTYQVVAERIRSGRFTERILLPVESPLHMPLGFAMDSCDLAKLVTWINNGFPNN